MIYYRISMVENTIKMVQIMKDNLKRAYNMAMELFIPTISNLEVNGLIIILSKEQKFGQTEVNLTVHM